MKISKEIKIALVAILSAIIVYTGIIFLKGLKLFNDEVSYFVQITDVQGMPTASDVRANGVKVGSVKAINFSDNNRSLIVEITINPQFQIPQGTSVYMTKEMLGSAIMNLRLGPDPTDLIHPGDTIKGAPMTDLMTAAGDMIPQVQAILPKVDSLLTSLNDLVGNPAIAASLDNMEDITTQLRTTTQQVNGLLSKDIPQLMAKANVLCDDMDATAATLKQVDMLGIAQRADATLAGVQDMTFKINTAMGSKDTSLGMLMNDNAIALHLDSTFLNSSRLLEDLRLRPKRYVHFSLFGRKNRD